MKTAFPRLTWGCCGAIAVLLCGCGPLPMLPIPPGCDWSPAFSSVGPDQPHGTLVLKRNDLRAKFLVDDRYVFCDNRNVANVHRVNPEREQTLLVSPGTHVIEANVYGGYGMDEPELASSAGVFTSRTRLSVEVKQNETVVVRGVTLITGAMVRDTHFSLVREGG